MIILSHRGYWKTVQEKNTELAFMRSFSLGYGTETDVRDASGTLVISHDMPSGGEMPFQDLLSLIAASKTLGGNPLTLALNVKADGLAGAIKQLLDKNPALDSFVFDMAVPDMSSYLENDIPVFTRMSEVEQRPVWFEEATGIWLDSFYGEWYDSNLITEHLRNGKRVCVVSSELHKRPNNNLWMLLKPFANEDGLMLCTDFPEDASRFFFGTNGGR